MKVFYSDRFVLPLPASHTFPMSKYRLLRERIVSDGIVSGADLVEPEAAPWSDLLLVHTPDYVNAVREGRLSAVIERRIGFPWSAQMVERSRRSVAATIEAARAALVDGVGVNLAGGTHHAFADRGEGYCVFNDVAVATRVLMRDRGVERVAVVDCDVHQGNGTAAIFAGDPAVFTFSMHGAQNFPYRKEASDLDVALPDGTADDEYLGLLETHVAAVMSRARPDLVFYVAGADPYRADRFGRLALSIEGLRRRDALVLQACRAAGAAVAVSMGGGYAPAVDEIVTIHANTVREAACLAARRRSDDRGRNPP